MKRGKKRQRGRGVRYEERERKKKRIRKISCMWTVSRGIYMVTVAILHNSSLTSVGDSYGEMRKIDPLCYFSLTNGSALTFTIHLYTPTLQWKLISSFPILLYMFLSIFQNTKENNTIQFETCKSKATVQWLSIADSVNKFQELAFSRQVYIPTPFSHGETVFHK